MNPWFQLSIGTAVLLLNIGGLAVGYGRLAQQIKANTDEIDRLRQWRHDKVNQQASSEAKDYLFAEIMKKIEKLELKIERLEARFSGGLA